MCVCDLSTCACGVVRARVRMRACIISGICSLAFFRVGIYTTVVLFSRLLHQRICESVHSVLWYSTQSNETTSIGRHASLRYTLSPGQGWYRSAKAQNSTKAPLTGIFVFREGHGVDAMSDSARSCALLDRASEVLLARVRGYERAVTVVRRLGNTRKRHGAHWQVHPRCE